MNKTTKWFALALTLTMPVTTCIMSVAPVQASEKLLKQEDALLKRSKSAVASALAQAGVISSKNAAIISDAAVGINARDYVRLDYDDGELVFKSNAAVMHGLNKKYSKTENPNAKAAEAYILQVAKAVGQADMMLRLQGNQNVQMAVFDAWGDCAEIAVKNLMLNKKITKHAAESELYSSSAAFSLMKYLKWNDDKGVYTLDEKSFITDFGVDEEADKVRDLMEGKDISTEEDSDTSSDSGDYSFISEETRNFWENLQPLADKQDLQAFKEITYAMCTKTSVHAETTDIVLGEEIPFEKLGPEEAKKAAEGHVCYTAPTATVRVSPQYVDYFNNVIAPKMCEFFEPLATKVSRAKIKINVCSFAYNRYAGMGERKVEAPDTRNFKFLDTKKYHLQGYNNIYVVRFTDAKAALNAEPSTTIDADLYVYHLPATYSSFCPTFADAKATYEVRAHHQDINGKHIFSTNPGIVTLPVFWYEGNFAYHQMDQGAFYIDKKTQYKDCIVNFQTDVQTFPYLADERKAEEERELERRIAENENAYSFLAFIVIPVLVGMVLGGPYMGYVWYKEKKRRWIHMPAPDGTEDKAEFDHSAFRPEFDELREWFDELEITEVDGHDAVRLSEKKALDRGFALIHKLATLPNLNADERCALNTSGEILNHLQKRSLCSNKIMLVIYGLMFTFILGPGVLTGFSESFLSGLWQTIIYVAVMVTYILADFMPEFKFGNEEPIFVRGLRYILRGIRLGSLAAAATAATTETATVYRDSEGNRWVERDGLPGCVIAILILTFLMAILPFLAMCHTLVNFFRNYLTNK